MEIISEVKSPEFSEQIRLAIKGDSHAFALLYEKVYRDLYRYAYFTLKNRHDAEDAVSEAVIDAFRNLGKLRSEEKFKAWFFKILSCKCKYIIKQRYKSEELLTAAQDIMFCSLEENKSQDEMLELHAAMRLLNTEERMIISLVAFEGYTFSETSKIVKINENTIKTKYYRALDKLGKQLKSEN